MTRWLLAIAAPLCLAAAVLAQSLAADHRLAVDRDRDGLDDRVETQMAEALMPALHYADGGGVRDDCLEPRRRPILYRARPLDADQPEKAVAITYVLLYARDCGALEHAGDAEAFTVFADKGGRDSSWRTLAATAIAHRGAEAERTTIGDGRGIWISRDKHANYAVFEACADNDLANDVCVRNGPVPRDRILVNAGEPSVPLRETVGDLLPAAHHVRIWQHDTLLDAGELAGLFFLPAKVPVTPALSWPAERSTLMPTTGR